MKPKSLLTLFQDSLEFCICFIRKSEEGMLAVCLNNSMRISDKRLKDDFSFDYEQGFILNNSWVRYKLLMFYNVIKIC